MPNELDLPAQNIVGAVGSNAYLDLRTDENADLGTPAQDAHDAAAALKLKHPDYNGSIDKWNKYHNCYNADDIYSYIHQHVREADEMFKNRVARGYYLNYVASVVDLFVAYLYHSPIVREYGKAEKLFEDLLKNADLRNTTYEATIQHACTEAQIDGHAAVLVDMPKLPESGVANEADRVALGLRPFLTVIQAKQIHDWELDRFGNFEWVKIQITRPSSRQWTSTAPTNIQHFLIWKKNSWEEWELIDDVAKQVDGAEHKLGEVPLVIVYNQRCKDHAWFGQSAVRDITDINISILNWCSLADEEIFERCLNILIAERDDQGSTVQLSSHNVLDYAPGAEPPAYLVPGATPLELIGKWVREAKDEIYRLAKLGGSTGLLGVREATSGIAYAYEFNETNQSLANKAISMETAENQILRLVAKWQNQKFEGSVQYPREFGVDDFLMEFQMLTEGRTNLTSATAIRLMEQRLIGKLFATKPQSVRDTMLKEVVNSPEERLGLNFTPLPDVSGDAAGGKGTPETSPSSKKKETK